MNRRIEPRHEVAEAALRAGDPDAWKQALGFPSRQQGAITMKRCFIVDIDGTVADGSHRTDALEQIRQVCADNAGEASNHKMALDFVHKIAIRAIAEEQKK